MKKLFKLLLGIPVILFFSLLSILFLAYAIMLFPLQAVGLIKYLPGEEALSDMLDTLFYWFEKH